MPHLLLFTATTGYQTRMFADTSRELGIPFTLATDRCDSLDDPWRGQSIAVKFHDPIGHLDELLRAHQRTPFTGVIALGDRTTLLASLFAERAGIPFHPPHACEAAGNKFLAKERFRAAGLPQPAYQRFPADAAPIDPPFPCVVKPLALSGSRGVIRANNAAELDAALHDLRKLLTAADLQRHRDNHRFLQCEEFLPGREFAIEGVVTNGQLRVFALFDKPDPLDGPYFEETIYVTPSREPQHVQDEILETVRRGVQALGLCHGPIHAEVRYNPRGAYLLEIAARPIGGYCARVLRFTGEVSLESVLVRHAAGEDIAGIARTPGASGVMMVPIPKAGIYRGVNGVQQAQAVTGITEVRLAAVPGQRLKTFPEASSYAGFLFAHAPKSEQVEAALREAHSHLRFEIATELETR